MSKYEKVRYADLVKEIMDRLLPREREVVEEEMEIERGCLFISIWLGWLRFRIIVNKDIGEFYIDIHRASKVVYPKPRFPELIRVRDVKLLMKLVDVLKELGFEEGW